jgi:hypothetical protein
MSQVTAVRTPATAGEIIGAIMAAGVSRDAANIVASQSADETASWKAMWNWNLGNVTASGSQDYVIESSTNPGHFRAFSNIADGAQAMVDWLTSRGALPFAESGDVAGYVQQLAKGCYLGCIGQTDQTGHVVSQTDYDNYKANISGRLASLRGVVPVAPGWGLTKTVLFAGGLAAAGFVFAAARSGETWVPRAVRRLAKA